MSPPQEFETNSLPLLPLSSKQVDNVSLNSYCILNRAVNHCAWHRSFLDLRFFFLIRSYQKFINIVVVLAYLYKVYKNYMYLPGQEKGSRPLAVENGRGFWMWPNVHL